jgi:hypothetical protein
MRVRAVAGAGVIGGVVAAVAFSAVPADAAKPLQPIAGYEVVSNHYVNASAPVDTWVTAQCPAGKKPLGGGGTVGQQGGSPHVLGSGPHQNGWLVQWQWSSEPNYLDATVYVICAPAQP